ncbi:MAG: putative glycolipid-binding domain-containing protein [Thermoleophilaceae bacterium]|nr:putative glycolipid-binding domain-containing protein [Thermoleophilaceae bacterium]
MLVWRGLEEWLAEACEVTLDGDRLHAKGTQFGTEPHPYRVDYELTTGSGWVTERFVVIARDAAGQRELDLRRAADGNWTVNGEARPHVAGALDCDLAFSPLTNFMPARRLAGAPADHVMAWVSVPDLGVLRSEQRYEPIDERHVRFVGLDDGFTAELQLDEDGLVVRYPRLAERVASAARA